MVENLRARVQELNRSPPGSPVNKLFLSLHRIRLQESECASVPRTGSAFFTATTVLLITFNKCMLWRSHLIYAHIKPHSFYYFPQPLHI